MIRRRETTVHPGHDRIPTLRLCRRKADVSVPDVHHGRFATAASQRFGDGPVLVHQRLLSVTVGHFPVFL